MPKADDDLQEMLSRRRREKKDQIHIVPKGNCAVVGGAIELEILNGKNIMILEDEFMSSYDCKTCKGSGQVIKECLKCSGNGSYRDQGESTETCAKCDGKGKWLEDCKDCNGKGALLEIPDQAKSRPTSGRIISIGPDVTIYKLIDRVAYSGYTGHLLPFKGNSRIRVMSEHEPFCIIRDVEGASPETQVEFIDKDTAYDLT